MWRLQLKHMILTDILKIHVKITWFYFRIDFNLIDWGCDFVPRTHASTIIYKSGLIYLIIGPSSSL